MSITEKLDMAIKLNEKGRKDGAYVLPYKDGILSKSTYMTNGDM